MNWDKAIETISPHVVKIETPTGWGTGFLTFYNHDQSWCGIATAAHVVLHADQWQQPIRILNQESSTFLNVADRVIFADIANDSAVVLCFKGGLQLPETPIALLPVGEPCRIGTDIGWLGYPFIEQYTLCFFAGTVSARKAATNAYLVDGVAINGVSGGPVFHCGSLNPEEVQIIGCVSAYHANRATGEALPGLLMAQDVSHFHAIAGQIRSIDEANVKKREFEEAQKARAGDPAEKVPASPIKDVPPQASTTPFPAPPSFPTDPAPSPDKAGST